MSQEVLTDIKVVPDVDEIKLIFVTNKRRIAKIFSKQARMVSVVSTLLILLKKIGDESLVRDAQLRIGADDAGHSEACPASNHRIWASFPDPCKYCPDCGKRLLS